jgi:hypothetical protein
VDDPLREETLEKGIAVMSGKTDVVKGRIKAAAAAVTGKHREQLLAMVLDVQTNRIILDELVNCYGVFLFTGGVVPKEHWGLLAMTSYLHAPFAADRISTAKAERYQQLAATIMDQGQAITAQAGPRTLRCRHDIADVFGRESSEIRALGSTLESAMTKLADELKPSPPLAEMEGALDGAADRRGLPGGPPAASPADGSARGEDNRDATGPK